MARYVFHFPSISGDQPFKVVAGPMDRWRNSFLLSPDTAAACFGSPCLARMTEIAPRYVEPSWVTNPFAGFYFWYPEFTIPVVPEHAYSDLLVTILMESPIARVWQGLEASSPEITLKKVVTTHPELYERMVRNPVLGPLAELKQIEYAPTFHDAHYDVAYPLLTQHRLSSPVADTSLDAPSPYVGLAGATTNVYLPGALINIDDPVRGIWKAIGSFPRPVANLLRRHANTSDPLALLNEVLVELGVVKPQPHWATVPDYPSEKIKDAIVHARRLEKILKLVRQSAQSPRRPKSGSYTPTVSMWSSVLVSDLLTLLAGGKV